MSVLKIDPKKLAYAYIDEHKRLLDVSMEFKTTVKNIRKQLVDYGVTIRGRGYAYNINPKKIFTQEQYEFFDGLMISDGSLCGTISTRTNRMKNFNISCAFKYEEFANYIRTELDLKPEVKRKVHISDRYKSGECVQHVMRSLSNILYTEERKRWYPDGVKVIPEDYRFTPASMNMAYLGDGTLKKDTNRSIQISFNAFEKENIESTVIKSLNNIGIECYINKFNCIYIRTRSTSDFLSYIGECPVDCYKYKWDLEGHDPYLPPDKNVICRMYVDEEKSSRAISVELGCSTPLIHRVLDNAGIKKRTYKEAIDLHWSKK